MALLYAAPPRAQGSGRLGRQCPSCPRSRPPAAAPSAPCAASASSPWPSSPDPIVYEGVSPVALRRRAARPARPGRPPQGQAPVDGARPPAVAAVPLRHDGLLRDLPRRGPAAALLEGRDRDGGRHAPRDARPAPLRPHPAPGEARGRAPAREPRLRPSRGCRPRASSRRCSRRRGGAGEVGAARPVALRRRRELDRRRGALPGGDRPPPARVVARAAPRSRASARGCTPSCAAPWRWGRTTAASRARWLFHDRWGRERARAPRAASGSSTSRSAAARRPSSRPASGEATSLRTRLIPRDRSDDVPGMTAWTGSFGTGLNGVLRRKRRPSRRARSRRSPASPRRRTTRCRGGSGPRAGKGGPGRGCAAGSSGMSRCVSRITRRDHGHEQRDARAAESQRAPRVAARPLAEPGEDEAREQDGTPGIAPGRLPRHGAARAKERSERVP